MPYLGTELESAVRGDAEWLHVIVQAGGNFVLETGIESPMVAAAQKAFSRYLCLLSLRLWIPSIGRVNLSTLVLTLSLSIQRRRILFQSLLRPFARQALLLA